MANITGTAGNTPLDWVLSARSDLDTLVLQVDLWSAGGDVPLDKQGFCQALLVPFAEAIPARFR